VVAGLGILRGRRVAVIGFERGQGPLREMRRGGRPLPDGYRKAQRLLAMAARFGLPVVTLIDTPGAYPGIESEERGLAAAIAETMALISELRTPVVAAIIGEGGSGGALALTCGDRVLMQEQAVYSVIAPEGAAAILYRDPSRAAEVAERLRVTATDVVATGIADVVVPEPPGGAKADPAAAAKALEAEILRALDELSGERLDRLVERRTKRYRAIGSDFVHARREARAPNGKPNKPRKLDRPGK
jgi:acetyl-CoA carboxylase carboxyl transferase alpha subunit